MRAPSPILSSLTLMVSSLPALVLAAPPPPSALLVSSTPPSTPLDPCLRTSYYGTYGGSPSGREHVYIPSASCFESHSALSAFESGSIVPLPQGWDNPDEGRIVWVGQAGVEGAHMTGIEGMMESWALMEERMWTILSPQGVEGVSGVPEQHVLSASGVLPKSKPISLLHASPSSLLLHVPMQFVPIIDTLLPAHLVPVALPPQPRSLVNAAASLEPAKELVDNLANLTKHLQFSPEIDKIVSDGIDLSSIRRNVRWLTGEAPSGIESRHSFTEGAVKAAHWLKAKAEDTGASCHLFPYLQGFAPDVICHYNSSLNSTERVILSAHYDSRGSFGLTRAPGGDDDGSGTGHLLAVAEAISTQNVTFNKAVTLAFFSGEEQGLYGSHYYAQHLFNENATVLLHIQADMLAYRAPGEPLQLGLPASIETPEASWLVGNLSQLYSPELLVGRTAACCSDHQSFLAYGFPATQVFERNDWIADPMYHNSGDISQRENYDFEQIVSIAKVTLAALLTVAGYKV